jgi:hypothetical protein
MSSFRFEDGMLQIAGTENFTIIDCRQRLIGVYAIENFWLAPLASQNINQTASRDYVPHLGFGENFYNDSALSLRRRQETKWLV